MDTVLLLALFSSMLRATTPLLFAALGGLFSERAGIVNIALEGIMVFGALAAAVTTQQIEAWYAVHNPDVRATFAPWIGLGAAIVVGALVALIHGVVSIRYQANQIISGTAINLMAIGIPAVVLAGLYSNTSTSEATKNRLPSISFFGIEGLSFSPLVYLAFLLVPIVWFVLFRTPFGLRLRAVGEHPEAVDSLGMSVARLRYTGVILSGVLAGIAGAYLSIGNFNQFIAEMAGGRGFIALAALIFGKWHPIGVVGATLLFGAFQAAEVLLGGGKFLPPTVVQSLPFILTMVVLAGFVGRSVAPKALGNPFKRS